MLSIILVFFIDFGSVMSEAHLNVSSVNCFNDYKTSMICGFTSDEPLNCSGYSLDILSQQQEHFTCVFVNNSKRDSNHLFKCGCTVEMPEFVFVEEYTASLLEGRKIINSGKINASLSIKPQAPEILSVMQTGDGNFNVTWKTNYSENSIFGKSLKTQLSYKKKGEADEVASGYNCTGTFCIIPGSELEPSSEYVIKARSYSTKYGTEFSDWSNEVEWITSESTERMLKIIIPIFFVLLVINICALYWCCTKLKAKWWDRIPNPSNDIKKILPGNPKVFIPKQYDPSSYHIDFPTISAAEEKSCVTPLIEESGQDDPYKPVTSCVSTKDSGISSFEDSGSKGSCCSSESGYKNVLNSRTSFTPFQGAVSQDIPRSEIPLYPVQPKPCCDSCCDSCRDSSKGEIWKGCSPLEHMQRNLEALPLFSKAPITVTELEYQPCDGGKTSTSLAEGISLASPFQMDIQDTLLPSRLSNTCRADDGYESFSEIVCKPAMGQHDFPACTLSPSEEGYQALQSTKCNNTNWPSVADKVDKEAPSEGQEEFSGDQWETPQCPKWGIPDSISYASQFMQKLNQESPSH